jgi:hypothetical protein
VLVTAIEKIKAKLAKYPDTSFRIEGNSIFVCPEGENGFEVGLIQAEGEYTVCFEGWHETFSNENEALNCFSFGLSTKCRLKEFRYGDFAYKWVVESNQKGSWIEYGTTGLLLFPFWRKKSVVYLQNQLVD